MVKIKNTDNTSAGEDAEHYTLLVRMQNGSTTLENSLAASYKFKHTFTKRPRNPITGYLP